jgi:hypothetical protein
MRASDRRPGAIIGARRSPSAKFHLSWPVSGLVNLRIWPSHAIDEHSGVFRFLTSTTTTSEAFTYRCGGSTRLVFPV